MERLSDRWMYYCGLLAMHGVGVDDLKHIQNLIEEEEQGLLLRLPCNVGDKAYYLHRVYMENAGVWIDEIDEVEVDSFILNINLFVNVSYYIGSERFGKTLTPYKTLFFTKAEAEAALEKMKGEEHEQSNVDYGYAE